MSPAKDPDDADALPHPRETAALFGHAEAERVLLDAYRGGRIAHAWLIGGEPGIGKATLAYRMARFVLALSRSRGGGGAGRDVARRPGRQAGGATGCQPVAH